MARQGRSLREELSKITLVGYSERGATMTALSTLYKKLVNFILSRQENGQQFIMKKEEKKMIFPFSDPWGKDAEETMNTLSGPSIERLNRPLNMRWGVKPKPAELSGDNVDNFRRLTLWKNVKNTECPACHKSLPHYAVPLRGEDEKILICFSCQHVWTGVAKFVQGDDACDYSEIAVLISGFLFLDDILAQALRQVAQAKLWQITKKPLNCPTKCPGISNRQYIKPLHDGTAIYICFQCKHVWHAVAVECERKTDGWAIGLGQNPQTYHDADAPPLDTIVANALHKLAQKQRLTDDEVLQALYASRKHWRENLLKSAKGCLAGSDIHSDECALCSVFLHKRSGCPLSLPFFVKDICVGNCCFEHFNVKSKLGGDVLSLNGAIVALIYRLDDEIFKHQTATKGELK